MKAGDRVFLKDTKAWLGEAKAGARATVGPRGLVKHPNGDLLDICWDRHDPRRNFQPDLTYYAQLFELASPARRKAAANESFGKMLEAEIQAEINREVVREVIAINCPYIPEALKAKPEKVDYLAITRELCGR